MYYLIPVVTLAVLLFMSLRSSRTDWLFIVASAGVTGLTWFVVNPLRPFVDVVLVDYYTIALAVLLPGLYVGAGNGFGKEAAKSKSRPG